MGCPNTPFATRLSGSAKETELRIRSMFQWKKKRPPVWLFAFIVAVIFGCIGLVSCREKEDVLCMGMNARVVEIDPEQMILYIQDIDEDAEIFGQRCALDCKQAAEEKNLIFVNYETSNLTDIPFAEFQVGDELVISMLTSQRDGAKDASALAEQVQLGTQRPLYVTLTQNATWYSEFVENISSDFEREDYDGVRRFDSDDRTLIYEDGPENVVESLVAFQYYCQTLLKFDKLNDNIGSDGLKRSVENERKQAAEGVYFEKVTIHEFDTLTKEDFEPGGKYVSDSKQSFEFVDQVNYFKDIYGLTEYAVVYVDLSWQWSEKALSMGPQLDNGRYERLYLVGKTGEDDGWKIYECFWGERVLGRTMSMSEVDLENAQDLVGSWETAVGVIGVGHTSMPEEARLIIRFLADGSGMEEMILDERRDIRNFEYSVGNGEIKILFASGEVWDFSYHVDGSYLTMVQNHREIVYERIPEDSSEGVFEQGIAVELGELGKVLLVDFFETVYHANRAYFLGEEPGEPQEGDTRIDSVRFLGSEVTFETTGEAYLVRSSIYNTRMESTVSQPITDWWPVEQDRYLVLGRAMDGELEEVRGDRLDMREGVKRMIQEESYGVDDWEVTLWHDANPYPQPLAVGRWDEIALSLVREEPTIEHLEGWEPIYWEGDFWEQYTIDDLSVLRYYNSRESTYVANTVELARDDFHTQRGIRIGDTRETVEAAYPELKSGDYWGKYPGEDYLWYCED